ncbi:hypothetical protein FB451DRAFT_1145201 [Mycena latifolia]|nr:hypothetical protein FB451DRAFT_1145201 [Mycena latifolia]
MSTTRNAAASRPPPPGRGMKLLRFKTSSQSKSDWLATSLMTAKAVTAAAECIPFPYVKGVFGTVVTILETVEKVKKNRDDLKELCDNIMEIIRVVQVQLTAHDDTAVVKFKGLCEDLENVLQDVLKAVKELQMKDQGLSGRFKEVLKLGSTADEISGYRTRIQELRLNFLVTAAIDTNLQVHKGFAAGKQLNPPAIQIAQSSTKCPPPSRILHGRQMILDRIHKFFGQDLSQKHIFLLLFLLPLLFSLGLTKINAYWELSASDPPAIQITQSSTKCPPPSRIFHGRQTILDNLHKFFQQDLSQQHIFLLHGLGGAGKTQIALKFIQESSSHFSEIFLIDTSTVETIETGLKNIATTKNVGNTAQDALQWLSCQPEEWLLLFDNADDPKINLHKFFPQCTHGNILITSRNPGLRVYAGSDALVSDMEEADAIELLLKSAVMATTPTNKEIAAEIVKELCYLPLAIIQAGAFISQSRALDRYLNLYLENRARLLSERPLQSHDDYAWTVYTTWQISFNQLSRLATMFLQLCSFLHHEGISEQIFSRASAYNFPAHYPSKEELNYPLEFLSQFLGPNSTWDSLCFTKVTNEISAYSLINFDLDRKMFSIHPLVHSWTQSTLNDQQSYHYWTVAILGMSITQIRDEDAELASLELLPHLDSVIEGSTDLTPDFRNQYGWLYTWAGRWKDAKQLHLAVLADQMNLLGEDHPHTLIVMGRLAAAHWTGGELKEAEELEVLVLEKQRKILGEDHPDTLSAMANLGSTYHNLGQFQEARELEILVLEKRRKILGEDHPRTLSAMANLGSTYYKLGLFQEAEELEVVVLEKRMKILGEDHPRTLMAMSDLGSTYYKLGQFQEAEELDVVVLKKRTKILGEDHPDTVIAMANLGSTYHGLGQFQEAEEIDAVVLQKKRKIFGEDHPDTLSAMANLGYTYHKLGKFEEAEELYAELLDKQKNILGDGHPATVTTARSLARTRKYMANSTE